jgi:hypothetical protein
MKKAIDYAVLGGSAITAVGGVMHAYHAFKDKKWMGVALGALTIGISVAAFKYSLAEIKASATVVPSTPSIPAAPTTTPAAKPATK